MSVEIKSKEFLDQVNVIRETDVQVRNGYHLSFDDLLRYREAKALIADAITDLDERIKAARYLGQSR